MRASLLHDKQAHTDVRVTRKRLVLPECRRSAVSEPLLLPVPGWK